MDLFVMFVIAVLFVVVFMIISGLSKNYLKAAPNEVLVLSGRKQKSGKGYRVIRGGAGFKWPVLEKVDTISLNVMSIPVEVTNAYTLEGVPVNVKAVANVKIDSSEGALGNAIERFLGMSHEEIKKVAYETLEGHLRAILGTMKVETINSDRAAFSERMVIEAKQDLLNMGLKVDVLTIQGISDKQGYLDALGKRRTAEVQRDAEIGKAEAERETVIKSSEARKQGEVAKNLNEQAIAEAENQLRVKKAQLLAQALAEEARAQQAGKLAEAQAAQEVADANAIRREKELVAEVIKPAEAEAKAIETASDARKVQRIREAEAEAAQVTLNGRAQANAILEKGKAEAEAIKLNIEAEAEGLERMFNLYKSIGTDAVKYTLVQRMPEIIKTVVEPINKLKMDKVIVFDSGNGAGQNGLQGIINTMPQTVAKLLETVSSMTGIDMTELIKEKKE